ncbi:hypothetical protein PthBH41_31530 [Parageobacillus thermoglucosidasius]|nr:hypothetical protein PthBH41_31530 [Parageobacillus thermoglucosidasius]
MALNLLQKRKLNNKTRKQKHANRKIQASNKAEDAPISPKDCPCPAGSGEMSRSWLRDTR